MARRADRRTIWDRLEGRGMNAAGPRYGLLLATSGHSGVDRVVSNLLPEWAAAPVEFDLMRIRGHGPTFDTLPANVTDRQLRCRHRDTAILGVAAYMGRERPTTVLTAGHRLNRVALLARKLARADCRIVIRMGMSLSAKATELSPRRRARLLRSMQYWYPRADAVIAPSQGVAADLQSHAGVSADRVHVIPNPIVNARLHTLAEEPVFDCWFDRPDEPVILGVGSLEPRKDFATLLRAFAALRNRRGRGRLVILGEGPERGKLLRLAHDLGVSEFCRLPGHVTNPYPYMARASVFALSSRREGSGAGLVEALAGGTPAVSTDCPSGPAETLQGGRVGPLVPVGDAAALADALDATIAKPPKADELRAAAQPFEARRAAARYLSAMGGAAPEGGR